MLAQLLVGPWSTGHQVRLQTDISTYSYLVWTLETCNKDMLGCFGVCSPGRARCRAFKENLG